MRLRTSGEGGVGISDARGESSHDHTNQPASHVPFLFNEQLVTQSMTHLIPDVSATTSVRRILGGTEQGVDVEISNDNAQAAFPRYSYVSSMGTLETTFLVDDNLVLINMDNISGIYTFFNLFFVI